jgi:hypothetical protein
MESNPTTFYSDHFDNEYINQLSDTDSDYDNNDVASHVSFSTTNSRKKMGRRNREKYTGEIPGLICIRKANKRWKEKRIDGYYTVNIPGSPIRNAVSGSFEVDYMGNTKFGVGSVWEDLFFKATVTTVKGSPYTLFYDSPEQYERHMNSSLSEDVIKQWYEKHRNATEELTIFNDNARPRELTIIH